MRLKNIVLLGIDPGLRSFGYAAIAFPRDPSSDVMRVEDFGYFGTQKATKKQHVYSTEDLLKRGRELATFLDALIVKQQHDRARLVAICAEAMSWPRNASAVAKIGIAWGVILTTALRHRLPILQASPQEIKKRIAGRLDATKKEVEEGVLRRVQRANADHLGTTVFAEAAARIPKTVQEHPFDAAAAAITCSAAEMVQLARRAA